MKKNIKTGWNGTAIANAGNNDRYSGSISLNYKPGKLSLFSNYNIRQDKRIRLNNINREYLDSVGKTLSYYAEDSRSPARPLSNIVTLGADYTLNEHTVLAFLAIITIANR